jgi:plastocyanin
MTGIPRRRLTAERDGEIDHQKGGYAVRARTLLPFALAALAGAAIAVLPALAAPSEAKLEVNENCVENDWPCWALPGSGAKPDPAGKVTIAAGGVVTFVDHSTATNIVWTGAAPTCEPSVPVNTTAKTGWEGKCTFENPGTYKFESASLWFEYTKYEIEVQATGTTGSTPTGTGTGSEGGSSNPSGSSTSTSGSTQGGSPGGSAGGAGAPLGSLFVGSASSACKLPPIQHGQSVHGSLDVSQAGAGGRLEVELLAARGSLASAGHAAHEQVGRLVRSSLRAGTDRFTVSLDAKGRRALHARGHLALSVKLELASAQGSAVALTRSVALRP